jgi:RNA polymerase sigma-70 factor (ECF subfamily)
MNDNAILDLYLSRSETAIDETARKYGKYCFVIANNILRDNQEAEECVNDVYMKAWEVIPPQRPTSFNAFLGKITRNISLNKLKARSTQKRKGDFVLAFDELEQCLPSKVDIEGEFDAKQTGALLSDFLHLCEKESRIIFIRRYWYGDNVKTIAARLCMSESKVKSSLFRTRKKLKQYLESEGVVL